MKILISNDDGYQAPGIRCLAEHLCQIADIIVVAPERDHSGASNSLTLDNPIRAVTMDDGVVRVSGTPTDCVHLAITNLLDSMPDMVISGINAGANMGDDVIYSGTVAAAMEGRFLGLPAIAISMASYRPEHYATAGHIAVCLVKQLLANPLPQDTILNVNVPDVPTSLLDGLEATRLGQRHKSEPVIRAMDPRGRPIYWIGPAGAEQDGGPGTDFYAVRNRRVSVTPIQVDLTRHNAIHNVADWLGNCPL
ncbi:MAG: 5'/3'-nucleotidase SurE [Thiohalomonadaceae bacterium]